MQAVEERGRKRRVLLSKKERKRRVKRHERRNDTGWVTGRNPERPMSVRDKEGRQRRGSQIRWLARARRAATQPEEDTVCYTECREREKQPKQTHIMRDLMVLDYSESRTRQILLSTKKKRPAAFRFSSHKLLHSRFNQNLIF